MLDTSLKRQTGNRITTSADTAMNEVVTRHEWLVARKALLAKEKALTRHRDAVNEERRRLPMVRIDKEYTFEGPAGQVNLLDLFVGRRQLIVYHFMFDPTWSEGCPSCSLVVDNLGHLAHLHARRTSLALVSRAPRTRLEPYQQRMGWTFPWYSSFGSDFNYDFHVTHDDTVAPVEYNYTGKAELLRKGEAWFTAGESHGVSVFLREGADIFHTYSTYARGAELLIGTYNCLDLTPLGRQEDWEDPPGRSDGPFMHWVRRHDRYAPDAGSDAAPDALPDTARKPASATGASTRALPVATRGATAESTTGAGRAATPGFTSTCCSGHPAPVGGVGGR